MQLFAKLPIKHTLSLNPDDKNNLISIPEKNGSRYYVHMVKSDPTTDFQGYLLEKATSGGKHSGEFITVFRGSESAVDWEGNIQVFATGHHPQAAIAMQFA